MSNLNTNFVLESIKDACGHPIVIFPAGRNAVSDAYVRRARVVVIGRQSRLPFGLGAYLAETNGGTVAVTGPSRDSLLEATDNDYRGSVRVAREPPGA